MNRLAAIVLLLAFSAPAFAAPIAVTSGEHKGYTRLVLQVDPTLEWGLLQQSGSASLSINGENLSFDTSAVFARISRQRLTGISQASGPDGATLALGLGCECKVTAFPYAGKFIVIDIKTVLAVPMPDPVNAANVYDPETPPAPSPDTDPRDASPILPAAIPSPAVIVGSEGTRPPVPQSSFGQTEVGELPADAPAREIPATGTVTAGVNGAQERLLEQLTMAAEQGLVDFAQPPQAETPPGHESSGLVVQEDFATNIADTSVEQAVPTTPPADGRQFQVTNIFDRDSPDFTIPENQARAYCPDAERLNVPAWGSGTDFSRELATLRTGLLREFDRPDPAVARDLVRLYIRYGLGIEAKSYLNDFGDTISDAALLSELAATVDELSVPPTGVLARAKHCSGVAGLWAVVAAYPDVSFKISDPASVLVAFADLPPDLRKILGPRLSAAFSDRGQDENARLSTDILERAPGDQGEYQDLNLARIALNDGKIADAMQIFEKLSQSGTEVSNLALVDMARMLLDSTETAPPSLIDDLGAAADEMRGTPIGIDLRQLEALWMAKRSSGRAALDLLAAAVAVEPDSAKDYRQVIAQILGDMSPQTDGLIGYINAVTTFQKFLVPPRAFAKTIRTEARQVIAAGLPNLAIELLQFPDARADPATIVLLARAKLESFQPEGALDVLQSLDTKDANILRIRALLQVSDFKQAYAILSAQSPDAQISVDAAWYLGDWIDAARRDGFAQKILQQFIHSPLANTDSFPPTDSVGADSGMSLAETQTVLTDSKVLANRFSQILDSP